MTPEEQLKAIIEAQVKGGCKNFKYFTDEGFTFVYEFPCIIGKHKENDRDYDIHILEIILDTKGCKAAYGERGKHGYQTQQVQPERWYGATELILEAWHTGEGNNWQAAIQTAYDLLPKVCFCKSKSFNRQIDLCNCSCCHNE